VLSGDAYKKIEKSKLAEVIVSDTIPLKQKSDKISVISSADLFADIIDRVHNNESISTHYKLNTLV
jgi:ribose-phosphate pyrophosphokinase